MYTAYTIRVWIGIMQCHMLPWVPPNGNIGSMKMEHKFSQNFTTNIKRREYVSYQTVLMEDNMMVKVDEKLTNKHANSNSWHVKPIQKLMNLIKILGFWINIVLQLLNTQSHHRDHIVMSHFNHLDHLCKTHLITTILDLRKWSDIMEGLQIPVSNLDWEKKYNGTLYLQPQILHQIHSIKKKKAAKQLFSWSEQEISETISDSIEQEHAIWHSLCL